VHAAYCTDRFLVLSATGAPSWKPNLEDIPMPPSGTDGCRTRTWTSEGRNWAIPLAAGAGAYELLPTAHRSNNNNVEAFPSGGGDGNDKYLCTTERGAFGLPSAGAAGVSVDGQDAFPVFNNGAILTPSWCEVDSCNEHVGQGGGPPHLHGDPFGPKCLYDQNNYTVADGVTTSLAAHPPLIGWSLDGPSNYGRYLSLDAPGGRIELDDCGGHAHDGMPYHYHARVQSAKANRQARGDEALYGGKDGKAYAEYPAFPMGPDQCWKAKFVADNRASEADMAPCCGSTNYYVRDSSVTLNGAGTLDTESFCALPADFGLGVTGAATAGCVIHGSLKDAATCSVACAEGYEPTSGGTATATFACTKGVLTALPSLTCAAKTGHVFAVTKAPACTDCVETTACVAVLEAWVYVVIVVGALLVVAAGVGVAWKCKLCCFGTKTVAAYNKKKQATKDVEMAQEM
jgi:hypothetical protein